jgi:hypothetical protein
MSAEADIEKLYVSDEELRQRLGVGEDALRVAVKQLERNGFPKKDPLFSKKRYWPAVKAFLDRRNGLSVKAPSAIDGQEHDDEETAGRRRPGSRVAAAR